MVMTMKSSVFWVVMLYNLERASQPKLSLPSTSTGFFFGLHLSPEGGGDVFL
jgi:hypothetical protein